MRLLTIALQATLRWLFPLCIRVCMYVYMYILSAYTSSDNCIAGNTEMVMPGDNVTVNVLLMSNVAMEKVLCVFECLYVCMCIYM
jgi:hypothetical protein